MLPKTVPSREKSGVSFIVSLMVLKEFYLEYMGLNLPVYITYNDKSNIIHILNKGLFNIG